MYGYVVFRIPGVHAEPLLPSGHLEAVCPLQEKTIIIYRAYRHMSQINTFRFMTTYNYSVNWAEFSKCAFRSRQNSTKVQ
jgi:hypothetical protein